MAEQNHIRGFVPPVFDMLTNDSFFLSEQRVINNLSNKIEKLESTSEYTHLKQQLLLVEQQSQADIAQLRSELVRNRQQRKRQRRESEKQLTEASTSSHQALMQTLSANSVYDKWRLKKLTEHWQNNSHTLLTKIDGFQQQISALKSNESTYLPSCKDVFLVTIVF
ncbi:hypothetical protein RS130_16745 [Paraglaciecola aquimarina]|uniref:Uncharacterized protein n=1 Tax=Paraglaciecola aquimarina TaxID=1235557 RepID=A0ABU3SZ86_9ALTE|nr:hypothetical protein [Paraglaciecola aquimarina]MDU0355334.1 hypothetical protein [Paraglaciecola aquimarina]